MVVLRPASLTAQETMVRAWRSLVPDGAVVRGGTQRAADDRVAVTDAAVLIEVTSNSSEEYDRGEKLRHYRAIATAKEILIVFHREPRVTLHRCDDERRWTSFEAVAGESVTLESIGGVVHVDDVDRDGLEDSARV